jgi:2'-5' RNA ligase
MEKKAESLLNELRANRDMKCVSALHLTINFLGEIANTERAVEAMNGLKKYTRFTAHLGSVGAFPDEKRARVIWLGVSDNGTSTKMAEYLCKELKNCDRPFVPHITLARVREGGDRATAQDFVIKHKDVEIGTYEAQKVFLKKSTLTPAGPIYENVYEIELD